jgi:hypothetical protein
MKYVDMLDLQGDGLIHQVVLARTLHIFDQTVFTQPVVQALLDALVAQNPDRKDGLVPVQHLADYLTQMSALPSARSVARSTRSGSRTPGSRTGSRTGSNSKTDEYNRCVDAYADSLVADIRGFHEVVKPEALADAAGSSPEEIAELRAQLKAHAKLYVIDAQRRIICPLWDDFDRDGTGVLEPCECTGLVAAYLHAMARKSSEIIRGSIELGVELSLIINLKAVIDEETRQQMRAHARLQVEAIHANVAPLVQQLLDKMANEDPHTIAGELLSSISYAADGRVSRDEFEHRFVESMQYVLGPEGLMDKLQQKNSLSVR